MRYEVTIPITGYLSIDVEAASEAEAIKKGFSQASLDDLVTWEPHKIVVEGNVYHGEINKIEVSNNDDD